MHNMIHIAILQLIATQIALNKFTFRSLPFHPTHTFTYTQLSLSARTYRSARIAQGRIAWSLSYVLLHEILVGLHNVPKIFLKNANVGLSTILCQRFQQTDQSELFYQNNYDCYYALFCPFILEHCSLSRLCLIFTGFKKKKTEKLQSLL